MIDTESELASLLARWPALGRDWIEKTIAGARHKGDQPLHDEREREAIAKSELDKIADAARKLRERLQALSSDADCYPPRTETTVVTALARAGGSMRNITALRELEDHAAAAVNLLDNAGRPKARRAILAKVIADRLALVGLPVNHNASGPLVQTLVAICGAVGDELDESHARTYATRLLAERKTATQ